jgi:hypothetical protein
MTSKYPFELANADERAAEFPYTFFVPALEIRNQVAVGDHVKLAFEYLWETEEYSGERMWVDITEKNGPSFKGLLDNEPTEKGLDLGMEIEFGVENIIEIKWLKPEAHRPVTERRYYDERCLVDECVLEDGVPIEYIYREEPDMGSDGDKYPDSGWRIRGRMDDDATEEELEEREIAYVSLAAVLNHDDSFLPLIDAPIGSAFMRDFDRDSYDPA